MPAPVYETSMSLTRSRHQLALAMALVVGVAGCALNRGPVETGLDAYATGDYATALQSFEEAGADQPAALHALGWMYDAGLGVTADPARASAYYEQAAALGSPDAKVNLALLYDEGRGVERDEAKATDLLRTAAVEGSAHAQHRLARMYRDGDGVPADLRQAHLWLDKAAAQGHAAAQNTLGTLIFAGHGTARDVETAYFWFALAAEGGEAGAELNRDFTASFLTSDQLTGVDRRVADWTPDR